MGLLMEVVFKEQGRPCSDLQGLESRVLYSRVNDRHKNMGSSGDSGAEGASGVVRSPASAYPLFGSMGVRKRPWLEGSPA